MAFKMKGHTLPGIKQLKSNNLDDGRSGSAAFQQSDPFAGSSNKEKNNDKYSWENHMDQLMKKQADKYSWKNLVPDKFTPVKPGSKKSSSDFPFKQVESTISNRDAKKINTENISAVQESEDGTKFVVEVDENEYFDPTAKNNIGGMDNVWDSNYNDTNNRRDTIVVDDRFPVGDLIDETIWEEGKFKPRKK